MNKFFGNFFIIGKIPLRPDEMASRAGFGSRAVGERPLT